jgi:hypothetical protein
MGFILSPLDQSAKIIEQRADNAWAIDENRTMVGELSVFPLYIKTISTSVPELSCLMKSVFLARNASLINRFNLLR